MKMSDITNEGSAGWETAKAVGRTAKDYIGKAADAVSNVVSYPFKKRGYSNPADEITAQQLTTRADTMKDIANLERQQQGLLRSGDPEAKTKIADLDDKIKLLRTNQQKIDAANFPKLDKNEKPIPGQVNIPKDAPQPNKFTANQRVFGQAAPILGIGNEISKKATASDAYPQGEYSLGGLAHDAYAQGAEFFGDLAFGKNDAPTTGTSARTEKAINRESIDILKLAGVKPITERDNTSGMTKVKEIKQLNESTDLNECGMMPSGNTTASLSINASAGSGEEVANMLKSLMDLAGVKPVTGDMLGGASTPMPMVKAIDIISRSHDHEEHDHDSMEPQEDELNKTPLTGMEEEYANTPAKATDVPEYDPEKMVFRPNQPQQGNRMDGTMPKANPGLNEENLAQALLKEYEAFKNGQ